MTQLMEKAKGFIADKVGLVKKPEAELSDVTVKHVNRDSAMFSGDLMVKNPYGHDIPIGEISFTLKSAGRLVISGTVPDPGSIAADGVTRLEIPLRVPYDILMNILRDVGRDWDLDYELGVGLTIDLPLIGNITLPVTKKGELKLPTISDIF